MLCGYRAADLRLCFCKSNDPAHFFPRPDLPGQNSSVKLANALYTISEKKKCIRSIHRALSQENLHYSF